MDRRSRPHTLPCDFEDALRQAPQSIEITQGGLPAGGIAVTLPVAPNVASLSGNWRACTKLWARVDATKNTVYVAVETVMYKLIATTNEIVDDSICLDNRDIGSGAFRFLSVCLRRPHDQRRDVARRLRQLVAKPSPVVAPHYCPSGGTVRVGERRSRVRKSDGEPLLSELRDVQSSRARGRRRIRVPRGRVGGLAGPSQRPLHGAHPLSLGG